MQVVVEGCPISYDAVGEGRAVVLIHGLGGSGAIWDGLRAELGREWRVLSVDLRGAGASGQGDGELSFARWAEDVRAVTAAAEVERPVLVGHSLGASIALVYALEWPDEVGALVLMGADPDLASHMAARVEGWVALIREVGLERWVNEHWTKNPPFSARSMVADPTLVDRYRRMLLGNDQEAYIRTCLAIAKAEALTPRLAEIRQPALVISGGDDDRTPSAAGRALADALPSGCFVELPGIGHTMPFEAPQAVADAVSQFLRALEPEGQETGRSAS